MIFLSKNFEKSFIESVSVHIFWDELSEVVKKLFKKEVRYERLINRNKKTDWKKTQVKPLEKWN